jgi:hypothetical protein
VEEEDPRKIMYTRGIMRVNDGMFVNKCKIK